jgi:hypothetical protein
MIRIVDDRAFSLSRLLTFLIIVLGLAGLVSACGKNNDETFLETPVAQPSLWQTRELPTVYPTATPLPSPTPVSTNTPQPAAATPTEVAFDQLVVDVTYSIPLLDLDRRIRATVAGEIEVIDENSGESVILKNRPGVVVEMQQALPKSTIEELPLGCDACVQVEYELPLSDQAGKGWLQDVQLLASLENYTAAILGPHFPPGTIAGLRREATPFEVAHSAAITGDGQLWTWTATEAQVSEPLIVESLRDQAAGDLALINWSVLPESLGNSCYQGSGVESLFLDGSEGPKLVQIRCPELYLPGQLVPIYSALSDAVGERLQGGEVAPPELPMTLDTLAYYRRADGASLTISAAGRLSAIDVNGASYTLTLTETEVLSFTTQLRDSSLLEPGPTAGLFGDEPGNVILIRSYDGVYELAWSEQDEPPIALIEPWNDLLELAFQRAKPQNGETSTPAPTATGTGP